MKYFARHKKKCLVVLCNLTMACALIFFSGCIAGADYENKMIYVYRITGPKVLEQFKVPRSKKEISPPQATETPDEILFRIIDTEIKRSGQLVYASIFSPIIHAEADKLKKLFPELRIAVFHPPFSEWTRSWISGAAFRYEGSDGLRVEHLDENCCPEEYKAMTEEDFDKIVSDFFAGDYDILLCGGSFYNIHRLYKRNSPIGKPAVIEKLPIRMKSGVKGKKWKLMEGVWRARTPYAQYQWGEYAVEPADPKAVQIIENLYGEK
jgi:hypothetical protein